MPAARPDVAGRGKSPDRDDRAAVGADDSAGSRRVPEMRTSVPPPPAAVSGAEVGRRDVRRRDAVRDCGPVGFVNSVVGDLQGNRTGARGGAPAQLGGGGPPGWQRPLHSRQTASSGRPDPQTAPAAKRPAAARPSSFSSDWEATSPRRRRPPGARWEIACKCSRTARIALRCPPLCQVAAEMREATGSGFPLQIRYDRIYEPCEIPC